jgi:crotonobetainyl-CoA:carnitine CoA-transferase CaiB-like acyl-CoA transferase
MNVYRTSDGKWYVLVVTPDKLAALAKGIGRADLLSDARFSDAAKAAANIAQLTAILDEVFGARPIAHWHEAFERAHITFGVVKEPGDVIKDPQLRENGIVVPIEGAGGNLKYTVSSPMPVRDVEKVPAKRAPVAGEHNAEILEALGFGATEIEGFRTSRTIPGVG